MTKPRSVAGINVGPEQKALRNVERIKNLRAWLAEAEALKGTDRAKSQEKIAAIHEELDRRLAEVAEMKAALDSV
jgi:hypothetical protein